MDVSNPREGQSQETLAFTQVQLYPGESPIEYRSARLTEEEFGALLRDAALHGDIPSAVAEDEAPEQLVKSAASLAAKKLVGSTLNAETEVEVAIAARQRADKPNRLALNPALIRVIALLGLLLLCVAYLGDYLGSTLIPDHNLVLASVVSASLALIVAALAWSMRLTAVRARLAQDKNIIPFLVAMAVLFSVIAAGCLVYAISVRSDSTTDINPLTLAAPIFWPMLSVALAHQRREEWISPDVYRTRPFFLSWAGLAMSLVVPLGLWITDFFDTSRSFEIAYAGNYLAQGWAVFLLIAAALLGIAGWPGQNVGYLEYVSADARDRAYSKLLEVDLLPKLRECIDLAKPNKSRTFDISSANAMGLSEAFDPELQVPTGSIQKLDALMRQTRGGAIGLAGPRGIGKSAVLWRLCASGSERAEPTTGSDGRMGVLVSAPTRYNAREFLLQLYVTTCQAVLESRPQPLRRRIPATAVMEALVRWGLMGLLGLGALGAGVGALTAGGTFAWGFMASVALITGGALMAVVSLIGFVSQMARNVVGRRSKDAQQRGGLFEDWSAGRSIEEIAEGMLARLTTSQTSTATSSSGIKPLFLEAGSETAIQHSTREMSMPELVGSYRAFLKRVAQDRELVVGIDELDKLETDESAVEFLNELKGVFGVRGTYFVISVSEDALSSFDRRGLPMRNAFDSSFDDVVKLEGLTPKESALLVSRRAIGVPIPFKELLHSLSAGIPRELIRNCRTLVQIADSRSDAEGGGPQGRISLRDAAVALIAVDLTKKLAATPAVLKNRDTPGRESLASTCLGMREEARKLHNCAAPERSLERMQSALAKLEISVGEAAAVRSELAVFVYYCRTVLYVFGGSRQDDDSLRLSSESLAVARAEMAESLTAAWSRVSSCRSQVGAPAEPTPAWLGVNLASSAVQR